MKKFTIFDDGAIEKNSQFSKNGGTLASPARLFFKALHATFEARAVYIVCVLESTSTFRAFWKQSFCVFFFTRYSLIRSPYFRCVQHHFQYSNNAKFYYATTSELSQDDSLISEYLLSLRSFTILTIPSVSLYKLAIHRRREKISLAK